MIQETNCSRKGFLGRVSAAALTLALPQVVSAAVVSKRATGKISLKKDDVILFTGDSITDGARERAVYKSPNLPRALGSGYAALAAARVYRRHPLLNLKIHNTGINGDTIVKLVDRWDSDCLQLKPTILSILVGVNDFNIAFTETGKGSVEKYTQEYRSLLQRTKTALPAVRLIIGEPYAIKGAREKIDSWYPSFNEYRVAARQIAKEFDAVFIPYQEIYDKARKDAPDKFYSTDGIHPSLAGIELMSEAWSAVIHK